MSRTLVKKHLDEAKKHLHQARQLNESALITAGTIVIAAASAAGQFLGGTLGKIWHAHHTKKQSNKLFQNSMHFINEVDAIMKKDGYIYLDQVKSIAKKYGLENNSYLDAFYVYAQEHHFKSTGDKVEADVAESLNSAKKHIERAKCLMV